MHYIVLYYSPRLIFNPSRGGRPFSSYLSTKTYLSLSGVVDPSHLQSIFVPELFFPLSLLLLVSSTINNHLVP